jgi:hypothetical protein
MAYTFEELVLVENLSRFRSREVISVSCSGCQVELLHTKKAVQDRVRKGAKGIFCSSICHGKHVNRDKVLNIPCANGCGSMVRRTFSEAKGNVFCSHSCSATYNNKGKQRNPPKEKVCIVCDLPFFASTSIGNRLKCESCHLEFKTSNIRKTQKPKLPKNRVCECGSGYELDRFHKSRRYCPPCKRKNAPVSRYLRTDHIKNCTYSQYLELASVKNKHPSWRSAHIRGFNRNWNRSLTLLPCQVCGYSTHIELAHIKAISDFSENATLGEINNPDNVLVLCRNHHWEFDHGKLALEDIPPRKTSV